MDWKPDKQQTVTRLALCVVIAVVLYVAADKLGDRIELLERCKPWLERNKIQAIAILAAVLFGLSLVLLPLPRSEDAVPPPEDADPCPGFERTEP